VTHFELSSYGEGVGPNRRSSMSSRTAKPCRSYRRRLRGVGHRITASTASFPPQAQASVYKHRSEAGASPRRLLASTFSQAKVVVVELQATTLWATIEIQWRNTFAGVCPFTEKQMPSATRSSCTHRDLS